ncbi:MAG TPA: HlyD family type I secretion periplasmic adaptor subunit [Sulfurimonas sp.]|nr:HlyD family type I secretion periplasmic adaptor subunit [Sulfurimonas sp.]
MSKYTQNDLKYMDSLSAAVLQKSSTKTKYILWIFAVFMFWALLWANYANVDELARGQGRVIPSKKIQIVQNLEGGIISDILVDEGEAVEKGQVLIKIDDTKFSSSYEENFLRILELKAKMIRLNAEAEGREFKIPTQIQEQMPALVIHEQSLFRTNKNQLKQQINILQEQVNQRTQELTEARAKRDQLAISYNLIKEEVRITKPLMLNGIVSKVEFLQLSRQASAMKGDLDAGKLSIPRIKSTIIEAKDKILEARLEFQHQAKEELNQVSAEVSRITEVGGAIQDQVKRTNVRSPVKGVVKQLLITTIGGVVQPGMDIIEIVPIQDKLLIETKIKPSDIAYLYPGQKAIVKFTAYDFSIYGGLEGIVTHISADTIIDEEGDSFYEVRIKTNKNFLEREGNQFEILVGMVANVDILTGKKTVMDYLLKPIIKARQSALTER